MKDMFDEAEEEGCKAAKEGRHRLNDNPYFNAAVDQPGLSTKLADAWDRGFQDCGGQKGV